MPSRSSRRNVIRVSSERQSTSSNRTTSGRSDAFASSESSTFSPMFGAGTPGAISTTGRALAHSPKTRWFSRPLRIAAAMRGNPWFGSGNRCAASSVK